MIIYTPILKQLPDFSSCRVFETYPGFETINGIHINANFQDMLHTYVTKGKYKQIENKNALFFFVKKILRHCEIKILILLSSCNVDFTINAGNCLFKMQEINQHYFFFNK